MKIDANDPKWTAYVLGELEDGPDKTAIEETLSRSSEARLLVEEIRNAGRMLAESLEAEPVALLSAEERNQIVESAEGDRRWFTPRNTWILAGLASAAALLLLVFAGGNRLFRVAPNQPGNAVSRKIAPIDSRPETPAAPLSGSRQMVEAKNQAPVAEPAKPGVARNQPELTIVQPTSPAAEARVIQALPQFQTNQIANMQAQNSNASNQIPISQNAQQAPTQSAADARIVVMESARPPVGGVVGGVLGGVIPGGKGEARGGVLGQLRDAKQAATLAFSYLKAQELERPGFNTEAYDHIGDNPFLEVLQNPLSTFSIDVDTASYSNMRRFLNTGSRPPKDAVRIEELVNYFDYDYAGPRDERPFAAHFEVTEAPWRPEHLLLRIGLKGRELGGDRPPANLVFLLDVSGSMDQPNKLPLVKESMRLLVNQLIPSDSIAIVVYAGESGLLLPSTGGDQKRKILDAIDSLNAGGSTNGASGIELAYRTAQASFIRKGANRVILATDGDFNVGVTNRGDLTRLIEAKAKSGIHLSALGFGMGNYKDSTLETLADKGDGNYAYIDTLNEARKVLVEQLASTLVTIAKDVKIQVEFNPAQVSAYRLIGYENRLLRKEDFNDDTKDAGDIGAGHAVTACYELVPAGTAVPTPAVDPLKYQQPVITSPAARSGELLTLKIRYKEPDGNKSSLLEYVVRDSGARFGSASPDFKFAAAVAAFGMILRDSPHKGNATMDSVLQWATEEEDLTATATARNSLGWCSTPRRSSGNRVQCSVAKATRRFTVKRRLILLLLVLVGVTGTAVADGLIIPIRPDVRIRGHWAVRYHKVDIRVRDQVADVSIDQAFVNTGAVTIEVEYLFPLPPTAAIDSLTLLVDGKEFKGRILRAEEARRAYEEIVRLKRDPALLEYVNYGMYRTSAFPLQPGKEVRVVVHYTDICRKDGDLVEVFYPLNTEKFSARPIEEVQVKADILGKGPISAVYSPTHEVTVERPAPERAVALYRVTKETPATDFRLLYRPSRESVEATVLSYRPRDGEDGYFLLMVSPTPSAGKKVVAPKNLILALDRSGSMAGEKIAQAKASLAYVLRNLNPADRFNVIVYNDTVDSLFPEPAANTAENVGKALGMIDRINATGGTNIHDALAEALKVAGPAGADKRAQYILFLTDGLPTVGKTDERVILKDTAAANPGTVRIFAMGIGYDVNVRLLDKLVGENRGVSSYVKEREPLEAKISSLYGKVQNPVMTDIQISLSGVKTSYSYPQSLPDLFEGDQIIMVGRYDRPGTTTVRVSGSYLGKSESFQYTADLARLSDKFSYQFVEPLWAVRRIGYLLDQIQLNGRSSEVVDELVRLSMQYGIITPYTSFLADERTRLDSFDDLRSQGEKAARDLSYVVAGAGGQVAASNRAALNAATVAPAQSGLGGSAQIGQSNVAAYEAGQVERLASVQNVGNRALFKRGRQWIDSSVANRPADKLNAEAQTIAQFSDEYFRLAAANNAAENQILAVQQPGEELILSIRGRLYRITPPAAPGR